MTTQNLQVGASADDAYEDGTVPNVTAAFLELGRWSNFQHHIGVRFQSVSTFSGDTVSSATMTWRAAETNSGTIFEADASLEDVDTPAAFTTALNNINARTRTTAQAQSDADTEWGSWVNGEDEAYPAAGDDLSAPFQEIADTRDPSIIAVLFITTTTSGADHRVATSWNGDSALAPKLDFDHAAAGAGGTFFGTSYNNSFDGFGYSRQARA